MKPTIDNVESLLKKVYDEKCLQHRMLFNGEDVGQFLSRGKRNSVVTNRNLKEFVFRRNSAIGIDEDIVATNTDAVKRKMASAIVKHIKAGKMEMPVPKDVSVVSDIDEEPSGPKM